MNKGKLLAAGLITGGVLGVAVGVGTLAWQGNHADHLREIAPLAKISDENAARLAQTYCDTLATPSYTTIDPELLERTITGIISNGWTEKDTLIVLDESVQWKCSHFEGAKELHERRIAAEKK